MQLYIKYVLFMFAHKLSEFLCMCIHSNSLEEISWTGHKTLQVYDILHNIPGVWDWTTQQASETIVPEISPTLVRLEESDYTNVGVFLPDSLVRKMEGKNS